MASFLLLPPLVLTGPPLQIQPTCTQYKITSLNCLVPRSHLYDMGTRPGNCMYVYSPSSLSSHPPPLPLSYIPCCLLCHLWLVGCCLGRAILLQDVWGEEHFQAVHSNLPELLLKLLISGPKEYISQDWNGREGLRLNLAR